MTRRAALSLSMLPVLLPFGASGCSERARAGRPGTIGWFPSAMPDELPRITNAELPFRYPLPQYARQLQGNVLLRLYVEADGHVVTDSTRLLQSSGDAAFDSAALAGAKALQFQPARRRGTPIPVSLLFPVHVRHPDARAFPGDTL